VLNKLSSNSRHHPTYIKIDWTAALLNRTAVIREHKQAVVKPEPRFKYINDPKKRLEFSKDLYKCIKESEAEQLIANLEKQAVDVKIQLDSLVNELNSPEDYTEWVKLTTGEGWQNSITGERRTSAPLEPLADMQHELIASKFRNELDECFDAITDAYTSNRKKWVHLQQKTKWLERQIRLHNLASSKPTRACEKSSPRIT
jgi:hypothetical protein